MGGASSQSVLCYRVSAQLYEVILTCAKETLWLTAIMLAHEYLATSTRPLKCFARFLQRLKHLQTWLHVKENNILYPRLRRGKWTLDGSVKYFCKCFCTCNHCVSLGWFGHDPASHVSARLSSALLSTATNVSASAETFGAVYWATPPMRRICLSYSSLHLIHKIINLCLLKCHML